MVKKLLLFLLGCASLAGANICTDNATGNWGTAATWANCGSTIPQPGDIVRITAHVITLNTSTSVDSILVSGASAGLKTDGLNPYTVTCSTGTTDCIQVDRGVSPAFDTSAGSPTNNFTVIADTLSSSSFAAIAHKFVTPFTSVKMNLFNVVISSAGAGTGIIEQGNAGSDILDIENCQISSVTQAISAILFVSSLTVVSNSFSGITGSVAVNFNTAEAATITDNTEILPAVTGTFFSVVNVSAPGMVFARNAILSNPNGTADLNLLSENEQTQTGSINSVVSYNIGRAYQSSNAKLISGLEGTSSAGFLIDHNIAELFEYVIDYRDFNYSSFNWGSGDIASQDGQGEYFIFGTSSSTLTNDIAVMDTSNGNLGFFDLGGPPVSTGCVESNLTSIGVLPGGTSSGIQFSEGTTIGLSVSSAALFNSISSQYNTAIFAPNPFNTFNGSGTGGVGIYNNDVYSVGTTSYSVVGTNAGSGHPSSAFGDVSLNPGFVSTTRRLSDCDMILGGPGTDADLFNHLYLRWNKTPLGNFTPSNIWSCIVAPIAPTNIALATAGFNGTYIGAVRPVGVIGGFSP